MSNANVNAHRAAHREREKNSPRITFPRPLESPEVRPVEYDSVLRWQRWFLPRKETRLMSEEASRTGGLFLPYPMIGLLLTLTLALGGGLIGLYATVTTMNATMLMRDADHREQLKKLENKIELQEMYTRDLREKQARQEERENAKKRN